MTENKDLKCSMDLRVKPEDDREGEAGRSLTEMLGVLAIVGVLSVGGIAGYTYAMNKHYANELLNGASQRAMILKSQKAAGLDLSLREFASVEVAGGEFSLDVLDADGSVGIAVSRVKGAVCKNLIKATEGTDITIAKDDGVLVNDITEEECDDENDNDLVFVFETGLGGNSDDDDNSGSECFAGLPKCGDQCCEEGEYCSQGADETIFTCVAPTGGCASNSACAENQYCDFSDGDCTGPTDGICTDKGILTEYTLTLPQGNLTVYKSSENLDWWSAVNLCQAHEKQMVTLADLGISVPAGEDACSLNNAASPCVCNGETDNGCSDTYAGVIGTLGKSDAVLWVADHSNSDSCYARILLLDFAAVDTDNINSGSGVLCR